MHVFRQRIRSIYNHTRTMRLLSQVNSLSWLIWVGRNDLRGRSAPFPRSFRPSNSTGQIHQECGADRPVNGADQPWGRSTVNLDE